MRLSLDKLWTFVRQGILLHHVHFMTSHNVSIGLSRAENTALRRSALYLFHLPSHQLDYHDPYVIVGLGGNLEEAVTRVIGFPAGTMLVTPLTR